MIKYCLGSMLMLWFYTWSGLTTLFRRWFRQSKGEKRTLVKNRSLIFRPWSTSSNKTIECKVDETHALDITIRLSLVDRIAVWSAGSSSFGQSGHISVVDAPRPHQGLSRRRMRRNFSVDLWFSSSDSPPLLRFETFSELKIEKCDKIRPLFKSKSFPSATMVMASTFWYANQTIHIDFVEIDLTIDGNYRRALQC